MSKDTAPYFIYTAEQVVTKTDGGRVLPVMVGRVHRDLPLVKVDQGRLEIAILNILGDVELTMAAAEALTEKLREVEFDVLVTAEAKSIPLAHELAARMTTPYVVLRKTYKLYMGEAVWAETKSITTGQLKTLFLDDKDRVLVAGKKVLLVDDVISTGSTLEGMGQIVEKAGGEIAGAAAIFTEGSELLSREYIALGNLPVIPVKS